MKRYNLADEYNKHYSISIGVYEYCEKLKTLHNIVYMNNEIPVNNLFPGWVVPIATRINPVPYYVHV